MRCVAVLSPSPALSARLQRQVAQQLARMGCFPQLDVPEDLERYYYAMRASPPDGVVLAMDGVAGLNAAEHLRRLSPHCAMIWGCDLDFSLQAYRLKVDYFVKGELTEAALWEGLCRWLDQRKQCEKGRVEA